MLRTRQPFIRRNRVPTEGIGLFCNYSHRACMQHRLDGFDYCLKHILEDKTSPYKQCSYISTKTNRRCGNAAPRADRREGYCFEHSRKSCLLRQQTSRKRRPNETAESLLAELNHYSPAKEGHSDVNIAKLLGESLASRILDYGSSSEDSDSELPLVEQAWRGDGESDAESIDSEQEDPLKHAGIYTAEEVTLIMKDKLIRLQSLYIEQFKRLQHILKEKRRKFLHTTKLDKDSHAPNFPKGDLETQSKLAKLAALKRYHQRHGKEALLQRQSKERRVAVSEGQSYRPTPVPMCTHTSGGTRCQAPALPLTKFCAHHVMDDPHQVLFQSCGFAQGECGRPVTVFRSPQLCNVHLPLAEPIPHTVQDSEEQSTRDTEILLAENTMETSVQSELSAVDDTGLQLLAAQSSILSAVSIASDALSASSDTLSATMEEPYMSSDVPSASSDMAPNLADIPPTGAESPSALEETTSQSDMLSVEMPAEFSVSSMGESAAAFPSLPVASSSSSVLSSIAKVMGGTVAAGHPEVLDEPQHSPSTSTSQSNSDSFLKPLPLSSAVTSSTLTNSNSPSHPAGVSPQFQPSLASRPSHVVTSDAAALEDSQNTQG
ncbi:KAT8 regulatory NSL complex subunit 2-like isoform X2 [Liolophura sinensis]